MVRYKEKCPPLFIVRLYFTPLSLSLWPCPILSNTRGMGNGSYGQLITVPVLSHTPCSSEVSALSCSFLQRISICHSLGSCTGCSGVFILILILRGPQGTACFPSATPWAAGMSQLWHLKPFPPLSLLTLLSVGWFFMLLFFPHSILSQALPWSILPFLQCASWRHHQQHCWNCWQWPAWGSPWPFLRDQHCHSPLNTNTWTPMPNKKSNTSFPKNVK